MRRVCVISCGRNVAAWYEQTLRSVWDEADRYDGPVSLHVVVDPSDDNSAGLIEQWLHAHDEVPFTFTPRTERMYAAVNQREAIRLADPGDDDIVVWLDLDGDALLPGALSTIADAYDDGALLTFGSHVCSPPAPGNRAAIPYPADVIAANSYRKHIMVNGAGFNHPRTMSGAVVNAIPDDHYRFHAGPRKGQPYDLAPDYVYMIPGLELAGPRHRYIPDPLLVYNHDNPEADWRANSARTREVFTDLQHRPPLGPLEARQPDGRLLYLPDAERRQVVVGYARKHGLGRFVETGTYRGDTSAVLADAGLRVDTIEAQRLLYRQASKRFATNPKVEIHHGDSAKVLPGLLDRLREPALFWLDGHQSGPETQPGPCPLRVELMLILAHTHDTGLPHVILVDDARCLAGQPSHREWQHYSDYPSAEWIVAQAKVAGYSAELVDDIIRLEPT